MLHWVAHLFFTFTGARDEGGTWYGLQSGSFGADWMPNPYLIFTLFVVLRHHNCANKPCWKLSRHITKDGHRLCHKHLKLPLGALNLPEVHEDHR